MSFGGLESEQPAQDRRLLKAARPSPQERARGLTCRALLASARGLFISKRVLDSFPCLGYRPPMSDADEKLTPADRKDLGDAVAFALRFEGRKRVHTADEYLAAIAAERIVRHLERAGFVVMKRAPIGGGAALGRGYGR